MSQKATITSDLDDYFSVNNIQFNVDFSIINYSDYNDVDSVEESFIMVTETDNEDTCNDTGDESEHSVESLRSVSYQSHSVLSEGGSSTTSTKQLEFSLSAIRSKMEQKSLLKQLKEYNQRYKQQYNGHTKCHKRYKRYYKCYKFVSIISLIITFCIYCYWSYYYVFYQVNNYNAHFNNDGMYANEYDYEYEAEVEVYYNAPHGNNGFVHDYNGYNANDEYVGYYYNTNDFFLYLWQMVMFIVLFIICFTLYQVLGFSEPSAKNE